MHSYAVIPSHGIAFRSLISEGKGREGSREISPSQSVRGIGIGNCAKRRDFGELCHPVECMACIAMRQSGISGIRREHLRNRESGCSLDPDEGAQVLCEGWLRAGAVVVVQAEKRRGEGSKRLP